MKTKKESNIPSDRNNYIAQFKELALEHPDRDDILKMLQNLELTESMLYSRQTKHHQTGQPFEDQKLQQAEMARLNKSRDCGFVFVDCCANPSYIDLRMAVCCSNVYDSYHYPSRLISCH